MTSFGGGGISLPPFYTLHAFETIDSTNVEARRLADTSAPEGTLVWSLQQQQGVGRRGRSWSSPKGNLYCSLLLRPECSAIEGAKLSFLVAVALHKTLQDSLPVGTEIALKWPNDILIRRQKVAGILLESKSNADGKLDWLIVGTGVNIVNFPKVTDGLIATSLKNEGGRVLLERVLESYTYQFLELYSLWKSEGFVPIRREWLQRCTGLGDPITVRLANREFEGVFTDLDQNGALILTHKDGRTEAITAGEVFFSRP